MRLEIGENSRWSELHTYTCHASTLYPLVFGMFPLAGQANTFPLLLLTSKGKAHGELPKTSLLGSRNCTVQYADRQPV